MAQSNTRNQNSISARQTVAKTKKKRKIKNNKETWVMVTE